MSIIHRKSTSPGEILKEEFLLPLKITQSALAKHIGCDIKVINRIVNERAGVTAEVAVKLGGAFNTTADFWMNAQQAVDLFHASRKIRKVPKSILKVRMHGIKAA